jgi:hypothetical protein
MAMSYMQSRLRSAAESSLWLSDFDKAVRAAVAFSSCKASPYATLRVSHVR